MPIAPHAFSPSQQRVILDALLAQVRDIHAGVYGWGEAEVTAAYDALSAVTGEVCSEESSPSHGGVDSAERAVIASLLVPLYDLDHPDFAPEVWAEADRLLSSFEAVVSGDA